MSMMSFITPSHDPTYLDEVWARIQAQTFEDWEWVIVANGERKKEVLAKAQKFEDVDVRVVPEEFDSDKIGALKRYACEKALGKILVELDHDDIIVPQCLERIAMAFEANCKQDRTEEAFLFSDAATCSFDGENHVFDKNWGWHHYSWAFEGRPYLINRNFPVTARSLCEIIHAPDHIRAWSREAYLKAGKHNPMMRVGDDHELIVRTYLAGVPFIYIAEPLYIHRLKPTTTSQSSLPEIQTTSWNTRDRNLHALVQEWCRRENLPMIDLGGAHNSPSGYVPLDVGLPNTIRGIRADIRAHEFPKNSIGCFRACDFLEHIPKPEIPALLNKLYDALVPGGWLLTITPSVEGPNGEVGRGAFQDPTHVSFWEPNSWLYYTNREWAKYIPNYRARFQKVRCQTEYPSENHRLMRIPYLYADCCALKGQVHPGLEEI